MPPRVLITRPAPEAQRWAQALARQGLAAQALPLIDIAPEPLAGALAQARAQLGQYHAAMFVSGNAVRAFLQPDTAFALDQSALAAIETRAWSPGPGTTAALQAAHWPAARIDAPAPDAPQFDSEALWAQVQAQARPGRRVLLVRGGNAAGQPAGRDWLAERLRQAGVALDQVMAYRRLPPHWGPTQAALAEQAAADGSVWLLSSAEAVANLRHALPGLDLSRARALATHPRIAQAAHAAGFGHVGQTQPSLADVVQALASIESAP
ncbi:MAG: uroporphyrinogen-III synthase [Pseudomonadota bacterium]|nr:uroporphyrinogen-III synthase [Pseudomonadota bacterium]